MGFLTGWQIKARDLIYPCHDQFTAHGLTGGVSVAGYDVTLGQSVDLFAGHTVLAVTNEQITVPRTCVGFVKDKSSLARCGVFVQNTVLEPGWRGYITLELTFEPLIGFAEPHLHFPVGVPIAQVMFATMDAIVEDPYDGSYQDAPKKPQPSKFPLQLYAVKTEAPD